MDDVKKLRQITGLSQSEFAKKYHLNLYTLQGWEQHRINTPKPILFLLERVIKEIDYKK